MRWLWAVERDSQTICHTHHSSCSPDLIGTDYPAWHNWSAARAVPALLSQHHPPRTDNLTQVPIHEYHFQRGITCQQSTPPKPPIPALCVSELYGVLNAAGGAIFSGTFSAASPGGADPAATASIPPGVSSLFSPCQPPQYLSTFRVGLTELVQAPLRWDFVLSLRPLHCHLCLHLSRHH